MPSVASPPVTHASGRLTGLRMQLLLLWLAANCLRMTILAVPPLLPSIHHELHLDETLVGALTALPVLLLASAAVLGSLLVARLGARRALVLGLCLIAGAGAVRGVGSVAPVLFGMTFLMGVGISISQPTLPSLVRQWFPEQIGLATAVASNGFLIGEILAAGLTAPFILPLVGGRWQLALAVWSLPVAATALAIYLRTPHVPRDPEAAAVRWWPDWRSERTWLLGLILGCASISYFGANAFIPDYLKAMHHSGIISAALTSLNLGQLPASLMVAASPRHFIGRWQTVVGAGALTLVSAFGLYLPGAWVLLPAATLGFSTALIFVVSLALPPLLAEEEDVHRLSAAMFAIAYACAFSGSLAGGAVWDLTGVPATCFSPIMLAGPVMAGLVSRLRLGDAAHRADRASPVVQESIRGAE